MILNVDKVEKSFGARTLFSGASFQVNAGDRFALVGPNGAGKTTLLKIIMGIDAPDAGTITFAKGVNVGYLEQETKLASDRAVIDEVMASAHEIQLLGARAEELQLKIAEAGETGEVPGSLLDEYGQVQDRFERLGGYELESNARQILAGLGFPVEDFGKPCREFSGGWQMRIALAKLFLRHPDLLLLDEPTNHLDLESVQWLRGFISSYEGAVLIVSATTAPSWTPASTTSPRSRTAASPPTRATTAPTLKQREDNLEQMRAKRAAQEREIAHMQVFVDKFRYKPTKAAQAQERMRRIEQIRSELGHPARRATSTSTSSSPTRRAPAIMVVAARGHVRERPTSAHHVYDGIDLTLYRGEHVALVGPNGAGKSTLHQDARRRREAPHRPARVDLGLQRGRGLLRPAPARGYSRSPTPSSRRSTRSPPPGPSRSSAASWAPSCSPARTSTSAWAVLSGGERARLGPRQDARRARSAPVPRRAHQPPRHRLGRHARERAQAASPARSSSSPTTSTSCALGGQPRRGHPRRQDDPSIDGDYDYYLYKREDLAARAAAEAAGEPAAEAPARSVPRTHRVADGPDAAPRPREGKKTREQRRAEAEARRALNSKLKDKRRRLARIEEALERDRARYEELMQLMASEELYADQDRFAAALAEYNELKKAIPAQEDEWLELSGEIEEAIERERA